MNGQYLTGQHLDRFWHGVCTMVPLGAWVPWAEVVQIASGHGFTEDMCFHCADHWQMLDGLEFDPMRKPGQATDPTEVIRIRFLYHRDIHGEQGLVCVSSDEENLDNGGLASGSVLLRLGRNPDRMYSPTNQLTPHPGGSCGPTRS